jgi:hypothetical protein
VQRGVGATGAAVAGATCGKWCSWGALTEASAVAEASAAAACKAFFEGLSMDITEDPTTRIGLFGAVEEESIFISAPVGLFKSAAGILYYDVWSSCCCFSLLFFKSSVVVEDYKKCMQKEETLRGSRKLLMSII